jgi:peptidoglycan/LPS O-acetylase OafA/YrhL
VEYTLGAATVGLLWVLLSATGACRPGLGARFSRGLARFSYTLYVVHLPLCVLVAALVLGDARWYPTAAHLAAGAAILILLIGYACGVAWLTEFRTDRVRGWAESLLRREPA